jgi:hypothetical protein
LALQQLGEQLNEFLLLGGGTPAPVSAQCTPGHFRKVEAGKKNLPQLIATVLGRYGILPGFPE